MFYQNNYSDNLMHYGVKGMKWGVRRSNGYTRTSSRNGSGRRGKGLTKNQQKLLKVAGAAIGTGAALYAINKSGAGSKLRDSVSGLANNVRNRNKQTSNPSASNHHTSSNHPNARTENRSSANESRSRKSTGRNTNQSNRTANRNTEHYNPNSYDRIGSGQSRAKQQNRQSAGNNYNNRRQNTNQSNSSNNRSYRRRGGDTSKNKSKDREQRFTNSGEKFDYKKTSARVKDMQAKVAKAQRDGTLTAQMVSDLQDAIAQNRIAKKQMKHGFMCFVNTRDELYHSACVCRVTRI